MVSERCLLKEDREAVYAHAQYKFGQNSPERLARRRLGCSSCNASQFTPFLVFSLQICLLLSHGRLSWLFASCWSPVIVFFCVSTQPRNCIDKNGSVSATLYPPSIQGLHRKKLQPLIDSVHCTEDGAATGHTHVEFYVINDQLNLLYCDLCRQEPGNRLVFVWVTGHINYGQHVWTILRSAPT